VHGRNALLAVAIAALVAIGPTSGATAATAKLTLDGSTIRPELALTSSQRGDGLMNRRTAPSDGMLFVFPERTTGSFWMKDTLVPLRIVFFDTDGRRVRQLFMTPCRTDTCRLYNPRRWYRFALELPASDRRPALRLGPPAALRRLAQRAT
jgi:uncharacterized membrane protein (UPF0127 family)